MASIINASDYAGYLKLTPSDSTLTEFYIVPKNAVFVSSIDGKILLLADPTGANFAFPINSQTKDHEGNTLADMDAIGEYISKTHLLS